ncbi:T-cell immunomodulatory protein-like [Ylistrum balloti]|uniref:T-cell immunomodulatory protein-like n=1 Tax=Ylistrum balloti TaxID=509963 RepID=UPI002905D3C9|nr:T-cell immunomodulatory protein-like [Ylistrum balloti]
MLQSNVFLCIIIIIVSIFSTPARASLRDVTSEAFGPNFKGVTAAFGDFNADKNIDIFVITDGGTSVQVLLTSMENEPFKSVTLLKNSSSIGIISNVVPADFDGDTQMDLLVTRKVDTSTKYSVKVQIYWGMLTTDSLESDPLTLSETFDDQPLLLDANGDLIPDLLGEQDGNAYYWIFNQGDRGNITKQAVITPSVKLNLTKPQSSGFVDVDGDLTADISLVTDKGIEQWNNVHGAFHTDHPVFAYPSEMKDGTRGQATYVDVDADSKVDVLMPSCDGDVCDIWVLSKLEWHKLGVNFNSGSDTMWRFVTPEKNPSGMEQLPVTLRSGDFDLDGFPDLLAVLQHTKTDGELLQRAYILLNVGCSGTGCENFPRTYKVSWTTNLHSHSHRAVLATFFDYQENGIMDVMVTTYTSSNQYQIHMMQHTFEQDACFMKVMVTSGVCSDNCPAHRKPYGINQPGPVAKFSTLDTNGDPQVGAATQLTQSAYFSLQQPYIVFGLGQTPNFVDKLYVGIPHPNGTDVRTRSWSSVIPNSQLVVIPYPHDEPSSWTNKLFVTPSKLVLLTGAALLGTCGFLAAIVGILHWREKVEDKKEKLQDAHKFHFDAM